MQQYKAIIWDYNGTLLNDLEIGVLAINSMLQQRNLPELSLSNYREVFTFPVKDYYQSIGFNFEKEDWDKTANEYIENYNNLLPQASVFPEAKKLLEYFAANKKQQFILSAMEHEMLWKAVTNDNIKHYFTEISGIEDIYATSKVENGKKMIQKYQLRSNEVCLLGDTTHDYEVAKALNIDCVLLANGHQSYERLQATGCDTVVADWKDLNNHFIFI